MIGSMKIRAPLKILPISKSFATPLSTKQFIPTGGEIIDISTNSTIMTPNQIKSKPISSNVGSRTGIVTTIIDIESMIAPSIMYITTMRVMIIAGEKLCESKKFESRFGILVMVKTKFNEKAPIIIAKIKPVVFNVLNIASLKVFTVNFPRIKATTNEPRAPIPAASVTVNQPKYIPPITSIKINVIQMLTFNERNFSAQLTFGALTSFTRSGLINIQI